MNLGRHHRRAVVPVINLKGGTGKTTTAVFLAHVLHEQGRRVLLVDADPQASAFNWNEDAPERFPFPVMPLPSRELHKNIGDIIGQRFDAVVIDTPPLEQKSGIVLSALRAATLAVAPVAPSPIEYKRLAGLRQVVEDAADLRPDGLGVPLAVLLNRTHPTASSTAVWREQIVADGMWCLRGTIGRLERYSQSYGDNIINASATAYGDVITELFEREHVA